MEYRLNPKKQDQILICDQFSPVRILCKVISLTPNRFARILSLVFRFGSASSFLMNLTLVAVSLCPLMV